MFACVCTGPFVRGVSRVSGFLHLRRVQSERGRVSPFGRRCSPPPPPTLARHVRKPAKQKVTESDEPAGKFPSFLLMEL